MLKIECMPLGELQANCYFVTDDESKVSLVIDPAIAHVGLIQKIKTFGAEKLKYILLTHGHFDHIGGAAELKVQFPSAQIVISEGDSEFPKDDRLNLSLFFGEYTQHFDSDRQVKENTELAFGKNKIKVIETPGHTKGSVCYILGENLFTGDTVMKLSMGRTDFPTGDSKAMAASLKKIASLKKNYHLYCGHGDVTTLDFERKNNNFMRNTFDDDIYS